LEVKELLPYFSFFELDQAAFHAIVDFSKRPAQTPEEAVGAMGTTHFFDPLGSDDAAFIKWVFGRRVIFVFLFLNGVRIGNWDRSHG